MIVFDTITGTATTLPKPDTHAPNLGQAKAVKLVAKIRQEAEANIHALAAKVIESAKNEASRGGATSLSSSRSITKIVNGVQ